LDGVLAFGDLNNKSAKTQIGSLIQNVLESNGFRVDWNDDPEKRIDIPDIDWKRRMFG